jgi:hypothetical protein
VAPAPATAAPSAAPSAEAEPAAIALAISADAKIDHIEAKGIRHADVEGKTVTLALDPWSGPLDIDVVLAGKAGTVHVVAQANGPRELTVKSHDKVQGPPRGRAEGPRPGPIAAPQAHPKTGDELHDNPYGGP